MRCDIHLTWLWLLTSFRFSVCVCVCVFSCSRYDFTSHFPFYFLCWILDFFLFVLFIFIFDAFRMLFQLEISFLFFVFFSILLTVTTGESEKTWIQCKNLFLFMSRLVSVPVSLLLKSLFVWKCDNLAMFSRFNRALAWKIYTITV